MKHKDHVRRNSIRLSLLHQKCFRCNSSIEVIIHIRMMTDFKIGIKPLPTHQ